MAAITTDFRFLGSCFLAQLTTIFFSLGNYAKTGQMGAFFGFFGGHDDSPYIWVQKPRGVKSGPRRYFSCGPVKNGERGYAIRLARFFPDA